MMRPRLYKRQRKDEELAGSVAQAYEEFTAIVGVLPDDVGSIYSDAELDAHYPPLPLGNGTRTGTTVDIATPVLFESQACAVK